MIEYESVLTERRARAENDFRDVERFWQQLDEAPSSELERMIARGIDSFELSENNLFALSNLRASLEATLEKNESKIRHLRGDVLQLYQRLEVSVQRPRTCCFVDYFIFMLVPFLFRCMDIVAS